MTRKSDASARFASSAIEPAISTPVGPPPTTTKFSSRRHSSARVRLGLGELEGEQNSATNVAGRRR